MNMEKGWYSRGYLPHFDKESVTQFVTFRLIDSLPEQLLDQWEEELRYLPDVQRTREYRKRIEAYLDCGHGKAWLRDPPLARMVEDALLFFDGDWYSMHAWVVMPNHVHCMFTPHQGWAMKRILGSWKSFTSKEANKVLERAGRFWQKESFDRYIRNEEHFWKVVDYIEMNPVKAGLCAKKEDWPFSSARYPRPVLPRLNSNQR